ncbi:MAG: hypothetical protein QGI83_10495 [Candidatus Latescibacteria bacterium]|nr:hypothetical protein [Candidatus Latescibacterota bacterium]
MGQRTDTERREDGKAEDSRRRFIKTGVKGALLLPYAAPLVETIALPGSTAQAASPPPPPPPPEVYSCVPDNGEISTNISVTINGASFEATPTVDFGQGINITGVTFVD